MKNEKSDEFDAQIQKMCETSLLAVFQGMNNSAKLFDLIEKGKTSAKRPILQDFVFDVWTSGMTILAKRLILRNDPFSEKNILVKRLIRRNDPFCEMANLEPNQMVR